MSSSLLGFPKLQQFQILSRSNHRCETDQKQQFPLCCRSIQPLLGNISGSAITSAQCSHIQYCPKCCLTHTIMSIVLYATHNNVNSAGNSAVLFVTLQGQNCVCLGRCSFRQRTLPALQIGGWL